MLESQGYTCQHLGYAYYLSRVHGKMLDLVVDSLEHRDILLLDHNSLGEPSGIDRVDATVRG
jgi:hypothetical protein